MRVDHGYVIFHDIAQSYEMGIGSHLDGKSIPEQSYESHGKLSFGGGDL